MYIVTEGSGETGGELKGKLVESSYLIDIVWTKTWFVSNINCSNERLIEIDQTIKAICFTETIEQKPIPNTTSHRPLLTKFLNKISEYKHQKQSFHSGIRMAI